MELIVTVESLRTEMKFGNRFKTAVLVSSIVAFVLLISFGIGGGFIRAIAFGYGISLIVLALVHVVFCLYFGPKYLRLMKSATKMQQINETTSRIFLRHLRRVN